jgi:hypothetical protein
LLNNAIENNQMRLSAISIDPDKLSSDELKEYEAKLKGIREELNYFLNVRKIVNLNEKVKEAILLRNQALESAKSTGFFGAIKNRFKKSEAPVVDEMKALERITLPAVNAPKKPAKARRSKLVSIG